MKTNFAFIMLMVILATSTIVFASDMPSDPKKQTPWGLYVDSREAYEMKQKLGDQMLFIDVRDPIEIMFTGFANVVDINIPFKLADRNQWNSKKPVFAMIENPNFARDVERALEARGLSKEIPILIMCRSGGTRGAPATKLLENKGYEKVYVVTDGFEGGTVKEGERKNWRLKNGWKNSGLPWSYKLNKEKMYFTKQK